MPELVVDRFEPVQIKDQSRIWFPRLRCRGRDPVQMGQGVAPVIEPGQRIGAGQFEPPVQCFAHGIGHLFLAQLFVKSDADFFGFAVSLDGIIRPEVERGNRSQPVCGFVHDHDRSIA